MKYSHSVYGSWAMATILYGEVIDKNLLNTVFYNEVLCRVFRCGEDDGKPSYIIIFHHLFKRHSMIVGVLLLMLFIIVCLGLFLGFHLYIASQNMTTNEYYKWKELRKIHDKKMRRILHSPQDGTVQSQKNANEKAYNNMTEQSETDIDVGCMGPVGTSSQSEEVTVSEASELGPLPRNIYK